MYLQHFASTHKLNFDNWKGQRYLNGWKGPQINKHLLNSSGESFILFFVPQFLCCIFASLCFDSEGLPCHGKYCWVRCKWQSLLQTQTQGLNIISMGLPNQTMVSTRKLHKPPLPRKAKYCKTRLIPDVNTLDVKIWSLCRDETESASEKI